MTLPGNPGRGFRLEEDMIGAIIHHPENLLLLVVLGVVMCHISLHKRIQKYLNRS